MADIAFPTFTRAVVEVHRHTCLAPVQEFRSPFDGSVQTGASQGPRWELGIQIRLLEEADAAELQAYVMKLRGKANRALLPYFARQQPRGTISTAGVTVNGALAAGATQATFAGAGNAKTLVTGDMLKLGDQMVMVVDGPYTADALGAMANVKFEYPLRAAIANGASVGLNAPTLRYMLKSHSAGWETRAPVVTEMVGLEFEEAFS